LCISVDCPPRAGRPMFWNRLCLFWKIRFLSGCFGWIKIWFL